MADRGLHVPPELRAIRAPSTRCRALDSSWCSTCLVPIRRRARKVTARWRRPLPRASASSGGQHRSPESPSGRRTSRRLGRDRVRREARARQPSTPGTPEQAHCAPRQTAGPPDCWPGPDSTTAVRLCARRPCAPGNSWAILPSCPRAVSPVPRSWPSRPGAVPRKTSPSCAATSPSARDVEQRSPHEPVAFRAPATPSS